MSGEPGNLRQQMQVFVLRIWSEWTASGWRWRGRVEHVDSGLSASFVCPSGVLAFLRGIAGSASESPESNGTSQPHLPNESEVCAK